MTHGGHLIAGEWTGGETTFSSMPARGAPGTFAQGTVADVDRAVRAAETAFASYGWSSREARARLLEAIAEEIEARGAAITEIGSRETGLPEARLEGERGRTTGQLRLFAAHIRDTAHLDLRHDPALPERKPLPRPDLRMIERPIGPVAVFGASNFPLAFSTAGGDTAAALAAGCPVVVKGHPAHPGTSEIVAEAIEAAIRREGVHPGVFSLIQSSGIEAGTALVTHPLVRAVGFTGSLGAGRALFDLCAGRPEPIPFFGELGSINPVFVLPGALRARADGLGRAWAASLTLGVGQFCTNPGVIVVEASDAAEAFLAAATEALGAVGPATMLTEGIAAAFRRGRDRVATKALVADVASAACSAREGAPAVFRVSGRDWLADPSLAEEIFGPAGIVVTTADAAETLAVARGLAGQLTVTLHLGEGDTDFAATLLPILERKAGRILFDGWPTGVEVADAMVHGGPWPASTNFGATSVGTLSIRRFLRPVCFQNAPEALLPEDLRSV